MRILNGVADYEVCEPNFESLRLAVNYIGENYSSHYLHGISGTVFRIGGICPCAPTCTVALSPQKLLDLLGYEYSEIPYGVEIKEMTDAVCESVDRGIPVLVWNAFSFCEWDIVTGYDENEKVFYGRSSYNGSKGEYTKMAWDNTRNAGASNGVMALIIGNKTKEFDHENAEIAAVKEAVRHANDIENVDKLDDNEWVFLQGKAAYKRWVSDFSKPETKRGMGDAYCIGIYSSCHGKAGDFLREIAPKYKTADDPLTKAAEFFDKEVEYLKELIPLLSWSSPEADAKRNEQASGLLDKAFDNYCMAIDLLSNVNLS